MTSGFRFASAGPVLAAVAALALASTPASGSPQPPEAGDEFLPLLYETLGGDQWHDNTGWMDPEVHWCDWYGVECRTVDEGISTEREGLRSLELPANNLAGELTEELAEMLLQFFAPTEALDLSGNTISGQIHFYPKRTDRVNLAGNALSGPLPPLDGDWTLEGDQRLYLERNALTGSIPESWSAARLSVLDLSDNALSGGHMHAIDAITESGLGRVFLTGNPLEGELTEEVLTAPVSTRDEFEGNGGIDICFTGLAVEDPDVREWLAERHVASSDFDQCLNRERQPMDATISGSWYNPDRSGEGVSLMMLDNGLPLLYSFSFDLEGSQQWTLEVGSIGRQWAAWDDLKETRGTFNQGLRREEGYGFIRPTADFRFDRVGDDAVNLYRRYTDWSGCGPWGPPVPEFPGLCPIDFVSDRMDYHRLTEQAGTHCQNQNHYQSLSGAWYDPDRSGEGFVVEVLPDGRAVVYWYTYTPDDSGRQAWMIGTGGMQSPTVPAPSTGSPEAFVDIDPLHQPQGGTYGPAFDPSDVSSVDWGSLRMEFFSDGTGQVTFESNLPAYGNGSFPIERLARPKLAECESESAP